MGVKAIFARAAAREVFGRYRNAILGHTMVDVYKRQIVERAAGKIIQADSVRLFGVNASSLVAQDLYYKLPLELLFMNLPQPRSPKNSPSLNTSLPLE